MVYLSYIGHCLFVLCIFCYFIHFTFSVEHDLLFFHSIVEATPVKQLKEMDQAEGSRPPSSLEETFPDLPESKGQPFEAEFPNIDESVIKKLQECLDEVQSIFKKGVFHLVSIISCIFMLHPV